MHHSQQNVVALQHYSGCQLAINIMGFTMVNVTRKFY